jgi:hypothetical protein
MVTTHYVALMIHKDYIYRILLEICDKSPKKIALITL